MRPRVVAVLCLTAALAGALGVLAVGESEGWIDGTQMVLVRGALTRSGVQTTVVVSKPVLARGFQPQKIFAERSPGVVTVFAYYGSGADAPLAQGSGFVLTRTGVILTAAHVIVSTDGGSPLATTARAVYVQFSDGDRIRAAIVGWDPYDDVGVLRVDPRLHPLDVLPLASAGSIAVGQPVAVIGSPFGVTNSLSVGVVSGTDRTIPSLTSSYDLFGAIQTDAPINLGDSGGPLLDAAGRVIGINVQIRSGLVVGFAGVGFAVPVASVWRSVDQLLSRGTVSYAYLGLETENLTPAIAQRFGYGDGFGALVASVRRGSPAARAGLEGGTRSVLFEGQELTVGGDAIVAIDGTPVGSSDAVAALVAERLVPGEAAWLTVVRDGHRSVVSVVLGQRPG